MFAGLFSRRQQKAYREEIRSISEISGAICRVVVRIHFLEKWVLTESFKEEYQKDDWYGFMVEVELSREEYLENRKNLEEYACNKVKKDKCYKAVLNDCIEKCANVRDYEVEDHLPRDDVKSVELQWKTRKWKEYVPVY